jgi:16S rRNA (guanine(966)-N(2))-methyltransferase RsmD
MRVIAGQFRRRPLRSLRGNDIRPTTDRLRETLFDVLCAGKPAALAGKCFVDLFAGTGAVGIEALSRGALPVIFVESASAATTVIAQNLRSLGISTGFELLRTSVAPAIRKWQQPGLAADIVFLDPPYQMHQAYAETLGALAKIPTLSATTLVIAEHDRKFDPGEGHGALRRFRKLEQGDAALSFYRLTEGK